MKTLFHFLAITLLFFVGCKKEDVIVQPIVPPVKPPVVLVPTQHTWSHTIGSDSLNLVMYKFTSTNHLKSLTDSVFSANDTIQYIKVISYYSKDFGQRDIHELEVYSDGQNVALNYPLAIYEQQNPDEMLNPSYLFNFWENIGNGDTCAISYVPSQIEPHEFMTDGNLSTRWASQRNPVLEYTDSAFVSLDTLTITFKLRKEIYVDSIRLHLGYWTQVFDMFTSRDSLNWNLISAERIQSELSTDSLQYNPPADTIQSGLTQ